MIKFENQVTKLKGQGHIQKYFDIPTLRQVLYAMINVGFPVALHF